mmetsp:Transcript_11068/g.45978  ORF Transcript_11068/g.45978 Transcript_11068/m.45978 type:complete len:565 (-) Transcript_11068:891-2585(-)
MLKGVALLAQQFLDGVARRRGNVVRVEVEDLLLDAPHAQELLHGGPRGVRAAEEADDSFEHVANGVRRHLERADLCQVFALDLPHGRPGSVHHGLDLRELGGHRALALLEFGLFRAQALLQHGDLVARVARALHCERDLPQRLLRLLLLLLERGALTLCLNAKLIDCRLGFGELLQATRSGRALFQKRGTLRAEQRRVCGHEGYELARRGTLQPLRVVNRYHLRDDALAIVLVALGNHGLEELRRHSPHPRRRPSVGPQQRAPREKRRVAVAPQRVAVGGRIHRQYDAEVGANAYDEELVQRTALEAEAVLRECLPERSQRGLELLVAEEAGYLPAAQQRVQALKECGLTQVVVLHEEHASLALHAGAQHGRLEVRAQCLEVVAASHPERDHFEAQRVRRQRDRRPAANARGSIEQKAAARVAERAFNSRDALHHISKKKDVELLELALVAHQKVLDERDVVNHGQANQLRRSGHAVAAAATHRRGHGERRKDGVAGIGRLAPVGTKLVRKNVLEARLVLGTHHPVAEVPPGGVCNRLEHGTGAAADRVVATQRLRPRGQIARR